MLMHSAGSSTGQAEVEKTTTFQPYRPKAEEVPAEFMELYEECLPYYEELYGQRLGGVTAMIV